MPKRKSISKKVRFEVFKRDSFKCQYCGLEAPNVLLHIDHIEPVSKGGTNDISNLITACDSCNLGKGATLLNDDSTVAKQRAQLEHLQERQEQLQMMMEWQRGLRDLKGQTVEALARYWHDLSPGWIANENGKNDIKKWLRNYTVGEITEAMNISAEQYLKQDPEHQGCVTRESWVFAFKKIPAICGVQRAVKEHPELKELFYIRGILRNRLRYVDEPEALNCLKAASSWGVSVEELKSIALSVSSWSRFIDEIDDAIRIRRELEDQTDSKR